VLFFCRIFSTGLCFPYDICKTESFVKLAAKRQVFVFQPLVFQVLPFQKKSLSKITVFSRGRIKRPFFCADYQQLE